ncbi:hypothetical protein PGT21_024339 [Puccinia graminis f. sp. tritici]|uniref:RING-type domain-containing protein n=1 Tax=Puccinia graminis f. sp. tritici TaxID=56615 RepID=A0A5B0NZ10_PUCGR|nr:hypothetical protein PGT21_024339 [Puccinia graminis f. sp. tritici]
MKLTTQSLPCFEPGIVIRRTPLPATRPSETMKLTTQSLPCFEPGIVRLTGASAPVPPVSETKDSCLACKDYFKLASHMFKTKTETNYLIASAGRNVLLKIGPDSTERHVKHEKRGLGMCSVCREEVEGDVWRWPGCGHYFHSNCVSRWRTGEVSAGNTCPNCRLIDSQCVRGGGQSSAAPVQAHQVEPEGQPGRLSDWRRQNTREMWSDLEY